MAIRILELVLLDEPGVDPDRRSVDAARWTAFLLARYPVAQCTDCRVDVLGEALTASGTRWRPVLHASVECPRCRCTASRRARRVERVPVAA